MLSLTAKLISNPTGSSDVVYSLFLFLYYSAVELQVVVVLFVVVIVLVKFVAHAIGPFNIAKFYRISTFH
jgi:hypothetical protein